MNNVEEKDNTDIEDDLYPELSLTDNSDLLARPPKIWISKTASMEHDLDWSSIPSHISKLEMNLFSGVINTEQQTYSTTYSLKVWKGSLKLLCELNIDIGWKLIVISSIPNHNHHNRTIFLLNWTVIGKLFCGYFFRNFFSLMIWFDCFVNHLDCNVLLYNKNTFKFIVMMLLPLKVYIQAFCQKMHLLQNSQRERAKIKNLHSHIWLTLSWTDIFPNSCHFFFNFKWC